ncbi:hypothetical protein Ancab_031430 [Ancistrocladus abbreviatus]
MGNYRFRLSEMIPNAWFFKLKDLSSSRSRNQYPNTKKKHSQLTTTTKRQQQQQQKQKQGKSKLHATAKTAEEKTEEAEKAEDAEFYNPSHSRKSYYFTRELVYQTDPKIQQNYPTDPPRKSAKQRSTTQRKPTTTSSVPAGCSSRATATSALDSYGMKPNCHPLSPLDSPTDSLSLLPQFSPDNAALPCSASCRCRAHHPMAAVDDILVAVDEKSLVPKEEEVTGFDPISKLDLPPIITKPGKFSKMIGEIKDTENGSDLKEQRSNSNSFRKSFSVNSPANGVRLRINSPRVGRKGIGNNSGRRSSISGTGNRQRKSKSSDSFAVVKSSFDPQKDFRESMVEMIVQNNIRGPKDLEELLACYLSLNSDEYHELIIKVFKQIWFDINEMKPRKE